MYMLRHCRHIYSFTRGLQLDTRGRLTMVPAGAFKILLQQQVVNK